MGARPFERVACERAGARARSSPGTNDETPPAPPRSVGAPGGVEECNTLRSRDAVGSGIFDRMDERNPISRIGERLARQSAEERSRMWVTVVFAVAFFGFIAWASLTPSGWEFSEWMRG